MDASSRGVPSVFTEAAGIIIEEMSARGDTFDLKTLRGPGSFAASWTPLHIASAYGIAGTAQKLIDAGARPNEKNALDWTPLHEAVHRGYEDVVKALIDGGARLDVVAPACLMSPQHAQYPLAHACRQGHLKVAKAIVEGGADKNAQNDQGWTALHEAAHFNQMKLVEFLLVYGCNPCIKTTQPAGAYASALTTLQEIKDAIRQAMPREELEKADGHTVSENVWSDLRVSVESNPFEYSSSDEEGDDGDDEEEADLDREPETRSGEEKKSEFRLLGDLPSLGKPKTKSKSRQRTSAKSASAAERRSRRKLKKKRGKTRKEKFSTIAPAEEGVPAKFCCALTGKIMSDPQKTPYGKHRLERAAIEQWIQTQGNVCPVTGLPLSMNQVNVDSERRIEISSWQLERAVKASSPKRDDADGDAGAGGASGYPQDAGNDEDDLYDF